MRLAYGCGMIPRGLGVRLLESKGKQSLCNVCFVILMKSCTSKSVLTQHTAPQS